MPMFDDYSGSTYQPGQKPRLPEDMVAGYRSILEALLEDGEITPEHKAVCEKALDDRAYNINDVIYKGEPPIVYPPNE